MKRYSPAPKTKMENLEQAASSFVHALKLEPVSRGNARRYATIANAIMLGFAAEQGSAGMIVRARTMVTAMRTQAKQAGIDLRADEVSGGLISFRLGLEEC